jgi:predicted esterase
MKQEELTLSRWAARGSIIVHALLTLVIICGCGSNSGALPVLPVLQGVVVETDQNMSATEGTFDVYRAPNADKVVVFLHGAMGTKHSFAYQLGLVGSIVEGDYSGVNEQVLLDNRAIAVFPQGRAVAEVPLATTWDNYVMKSGRNDAQFLRDLVAYMEGRYHISRFYLVGHSNGGMMVNRAWCETPELFDAYVSIAGPPSEHFLLPGTCSPSRVKPYLAIVGSEDMTLQVPGHWGDMQWAINPVLVNPAAFVDPVLIGERYFLDKRVHMMACGETVGAGDIDAVTHGAVTLWSYCNDSIQLVRVEAGGHSFNALQTAAGRSMLDLAFAFLR